MEAEEFFPDKPFDGVDADELTEKELFEQMDWAISQTIKQMQMIIFFAVKWEQDDILTNLQHVVGSMFKEAYEARCKGVQVEIDEFRSPTLH